MSGILFSALDKLKAWYQKFTQSVKDEKYLVGLKLLNYGRQKEENEKPKQTETIKQLRDEKVELEEKFESEASLQQNQETLNQTSNLEEDEKQKEVIE